MVSIRVRVRIRVRFMVSVKGKCPGREIPRDKCPTLLITSARRPLSPLPPPPSRQHRSYNDCLVVRRENSQNCSELCCVRQLYTQ